MRNRYLVMGLAFVGLFVGLLNVVLGSLLASTTLSLVVPSDPQSPTEPIEVELLIEAASNLGAFEFDLSYDHELAEVTGITLHELMGDTSDVCDSEMTRCAMALGPLDEDEVTGLGAYSYGTGAGLSGEGTLAVIHLQPTGQEGTLVLTLENGLLSDVDAAAPEAVPIVEETIILANASFVGSVEFEGRPNKPHARWSMPLEVSLTTPGQDAPTYSFTPLTDEYGTFTITNEIAAGSYEVRVKHAHTLQVMQVESFPANDTINFGTLPEGDANQDNFVTILDFSLLAGSFGKCDGTAGFDGRADFNEDGCVTILDFSLFANNFGQGGTSQAATPSREANLNTNAVDLLISPSQTNVKPESDFSVSVQVEAGSQQVDGAQATLNFDPTLLQVQEIRAGDQLSLELLNQFDNEAGTIDFAAGSLDAFPSQTFELMQIEFRALEESPSEGTSLAFDLDGSLATNITFGGTSVLGEHSDGTILIDDPSSVTLGDLSAGASTRWLLGSGLLALALALLAATLIVRRRRSHALSQ